MEKRLFLAIILSTIILIVYNFLVYKDLDQREILSPQKIDSSPQRKESQAKRKSLKIPKENLFIQGKLVKIELNPEGEIVGWWLKDFRKDDKEKVNMVRSQPRIPPLALSVQGKRIFPDAFRISERKKIFLYGPSPLLKGLGLKKIITPVEDSYVMIVKLVFENPSDEEITLEGFSLGWRGGAFSLLEEANHIYFDGKKIRKVHYKKEGLLRGITSLFGLGQRKPLEDIKPPVKSVWVAQKGRYFLTVIIPPSGTLTIFRRTKDEFLEKDLLTHKITVSPFTSKALSYRVYCGPKDYERLKKFYPGAEKLAGFNFLSLLVLKTLQLFYRFCHNYGVAIILLAFVIKILLYPLSHASLKSIKAMQKLQPEMERIRTKYRNDRERLNKEIILLYRRHKVNPLSGCLPFLLQLPVLYAIFTTLRNAVELRGAHFILWIKDLSEHDPFYILPLMMGVTMFIQQKLSTTDPQQTKFMTIMTIVFTFFFMGFPSGLVLYWLFQNVFSILHQLVVNRWK